MNVPKLRFKEFNDEWKIYKFYDVVIIKNGQVNPNDKKYRNLPHIGPGNIEKETGRLLEYNLAKEDKLISSKYLFSDNDIIYGKINPHFAKVCFPKFRGLCSADAYPITPIKEYLIPNFLLYLLLNKRFTKFATSVSMRTGMPKINRDELGAYKFKIPSLQEQEKIGAFLSLLDKKIELQSKKIEALKLYKLYYIDVCINDKNEKKIILSKIGCFYRGLSYNSNNVVNNGLLVLRSNNIDNGIINYKNIQFVNKICSKEILLQDKDIVICMANGSKDLVGKSGEYIKNSKYKLITVGAFCSIFRSDENYVKYIFQSSSYHKKLDKMFEGTNINNLKNSNLEKLTFGIDNNIDKYVLILNKLDFKIKLEKEKLSNLESLKKGLMQKMFV